MPADPKSPLIINPVWHYAHPSIEQALYELGAEGWGVLRAFGSVGVDRVRCHLASKALQTPHEWWVWVDSDMVITADTLRRLVSSARERDASILAAPAVTRGKRELNIVPAAQEPITLGAAGGVIEALKAGTALMATHRRVFQDMWDALPEVDYVDDESGETFEGRPFFRPLIRNRTHYGEDFSLCMRARDFGHRVYVDTRILVGHDANTVLTVEDVKGATRVA